MAENIKANDVAAWTAQTSKEPLFTFGKTMYVIGFLFTMLAFFMPVFHFYIDGAKKNEYIKVPAMLLSWEVATTGVFILFAVCFSVYLYYYQLKNKTLPFLKKMDLNVLQVFTCSVLVSYFAILFGTVSFLSPILWSGLFLGSWGVTILLFSSILILKNIKSGDELMNILNIKVAPKKEKSQAAAQEVKEKVEPVKEVTPEPEKEEKEDSKKGKEDVSFEDY